MKYNLFIGRWSPFHAGHKYIIDSYVNNGKPVCIALRETDIDFKNPISMELREKRIKEIYKDNPLVKVITIPDIEEVCVGRGVGYAIMQVPDNIKNISATQIRNEGSDFYNNGKGVCVWFTGLPCSGKTTTAKQLKFKLDRLGIACQHLDGDEIRKTICKDLGFSKEDRNENLKRVAKLTKTLVDQGIVVLCSFVSPYQSQREMVKEIIGKEKFIGIEIYSSIETCSKRDVKGMWQKAKDGIIKGFTGYDSPFESTKDFYLFSGEDGALNKNVFSIIKLLKEKGFINE